MSLAMLERRRVLAVGPALAAIAREALAGAILEVAAPEQALAALHSGLDLVIIDADALHPDVARELIEAIVQRQIHCGVLLTGFHLPAALVRALFRVARSDVLEAPVSHAELVRAAGLVLVETTAPAPPPSRASHCWSVMGAVGGCGATTLAIELAATLARRARQPGSVALVDLNLADGAAAAYLGAAANMRLAEASATPDRIDSAILDVFAVRIEAGFDLLACARDPLAFVRVSPEAVCRLMETACQAYDFVIVDLPRHRQAWTLDVLGGSDEIRILSELTVPALLSARAVADEIETDSPERQRPRLILNRMANRAFGPAPSRSEAEKALGRKVDGAVTSDWEAAACSVNLGGPISQHRPRSKIVKDVVSIVDRLNAQPLKAADKGSRVA